MRETQEEVGLVVPFDAVKFVHLRVVSNQVSWFFAAHLPETVLGDVRMGDEGQGWQAMRPEAYLADDTAIPHFQHILRVYLNRIGRDDA